MQIWSDLKKSPPKPGDFQNTCNKTKKADNFCHDIPTSLVAFAVLSCCTFGSDESSMVGTELSLFGGNLLTPMTS